MDATLIAALTDYMETFKDTIIDVLPWVVPVAGGLLALRLGISYAVGFFRRFSK